MVPVQPEASVVQTGLGLKYIGSGDHQHAFAYSGLYSASTTDNRIVLDFTTGSGYIVGRIQVNAAVDDDSGLYAMSFSIIKFNDIGIAIIATSDSAIDGPSVVYQPVVIPPLTHVTCTLDNEGTAADQFGSVTFTGRVYGTE